MISIFALEKKKGSKRRVKDKKAQWRYRDGDRDMDVYHTNTREWRDG